MARKMELQLRRDTAANWTATNPTLAAGEPGFESDTNKLKLGDGATAWNSLGYFGAASASPLTTKGDIWGYSSTNARIPVGANGLVLQADSTQTLGVKWASVGGAGAVEYDYVENTAGVTVTATSDGNGNGTAWIDGNAVAYDGATRIKIECYAPFWNYNISNANILVNLYDGTTDLGRMANMGPSATTSTNQNVTPLYAARFLTPSNATHTYHIRAWKSSASGTAAIGGAAGGASAYLPGWYRITKA